MKIDYGVLPKHIRYGMYRYIEFGDVPGDFLTQVICDRLVSSFHRADDINTARMKDIAYFMYNYAPFPCRGSQEKMDAWAKAGGAQGQEMVYEHVNAITEPPEIRIVDHGEIDGVAFRELKSSHEED